LKAELYVLAVVSDPLTPEEQRDLERIRELSRQFNATFITRPAGSRAVGPVIVEVAQELGVSQIVIGQPQSTKNGLFARQAANPIDYVLRHAEFMDLHVVSSTRESSQAN
jgi:two-component system sensor histidine kinase KdpD